MKAFFLGLILLSFAPLSFAKKPTCFQRVSKYSLPEISDTLCFEELALKKKSADSYSLIAKEPTRNLDVALHVKNILSRPEASELDPNDTWDFSSEGEGQYEFVDEGRTFHKITTGYNEGTEYGLKLKVQRQDGELVLNTSYFDFDNYCPEKPSIALDVWLCEGSFCRDSQPAQFCQIE